MPDKMAHSARKAVGRALPSTRAKGRRGLEQSVRTVIHSKTRTELAARSACALASLLSFSALRAAAKALSSSLSCPAASPYKFQNVKL